MTIRLTLLALAGIATIVSAVPASAAADAAWTTKVRKLLASKQTYPDAAQQRGDQGTAMLKLSIDADGKLQSVELTQPSGSRVLDREAVSLPGKVGTFPAPGASATVTVPLTWKLS